MSQHLKQGGDRKSLAFPNGTEQEVYGATEIVTVESYERDGSYVVTDWMKRLRRAGRLSVLFYEDAPPTREISPRTAAAADFGSPMAGGRPYT